MGQDTARGTINHEWQTPTGTESDRDLSRWGEKVDIGGDSEEYRVQQE